jgi:hypothetical protein
MLGIKLEKGKKELEDKETPLPSVDGTQNIEDLVTTYEFEEDPTDHIVEKFDHGFITDAKVKPT